VFLTYGVTESDFMNQNSPTGRLLARHHVSVEAALPRWRAVRAMGAQFGEQL
jgi:hypothetical protein